MLPLLAAAQSAPVAQPSPLDGQWKGALKVPGGNLEVIFTVLKLTDGTYFSTLDVPLQKVSRMTVKTQVDSARVTFEAQEAGSRFSGKLAPDAKSISGEWQQPGFTAPLVLAKLAPVAATAKAGKLPPPYRVEDVAFTNTKANLRLEGTLTIPAGPGPFAAVVLVSDSGPQDRDATTDNYRPFGAIADYLTRRGFAVLRFDDRGTGKSGGAFASATTADFVTDAQAGMNFLRARPEIDIERIGLVGHGEGANVAMMAATQPLPPAFVVSLAGFGLAGGEALIQQQVGVMRSVGADAAKLDEMVKRQRSMQEIIRQVADNDQAQAIVANMLRQSNSAMDEATARLGAVQFTSPWYRYFLNMNPAVTMAQVRCPVLAINGTKDLQVAADANLSAIEKGLKGNRDVTVKKLNGVNHLLQSDPAEWTIVAGERQPTISPQMLEAMREWIALHTKR
ncbi:alpha/beta hydrolase family protein [Hymenobacter translucens]|uniref:alpha/beta hydrolase family protein n=1 Tax=Hymenobacter translucens TaxID=2886507 RepID=UPI001D0F36FC|nr:alpha/beta hydrolase [Hymenobacter translucens]